MNVKKSIRQFQKIFFRQHKDYTFGLYILRVASFLLTWLYAPFVLFSYQKRVDFHSKTNPVLKYYLAELAACDQKLNEGFNARFLKNNRYNFNGIILPAVRDVTTLRFIYEDVLSIYTEQNDNYNFKIVEQAERKSTEGPFCYIGPNGEDITIHENDIVIDAGAWIGDFSAYCAKKNAFAYAFEPSASTRKILEQTINYNLAGNRIRIEPYGLGDIEEVLNFNEDELGAANNFSKNGGLQVKVVSLDSWAISNNIQKIDFIKADIEGYERNMLLGSKEVLKNFEPVLSICTYHYPDDPEVLEKIILDINPRYQVIQRKMKLFAYTEKNEQHS